MGELGQIRRYHYWSNRLTRQIADDNDIPLSRRLRWTARIPSFPFIGQVEVGNETRDLRRNEVAEKIETAIGSLAVEDFTTPPPVTFAKGTGAVTIAPFLSYYGPAKRAACIHTRTKSSNGCHVEVCLFGSMDNFPDYYSQSDVDAKGWRASSAWAIDEFVASRGLQNDQYDDDEAMAVEILRTIRNEGMITKSVKDLVVSGEWFADIFKDVVLSKDRWTLQPGEDVDEKVDRILIGFPLWVRTPLAQPIKL
jgi:hypothetical protein